MDLTIGIIAVVIAAIIIFKVAFFTIKRVVINLVLGWITWYAIDQFLHLTINMDLLMWALTALLGPIAVVGAAIWHAFM